MITLAGRSPPGLGAVRDRSLISILVVGARRGWTSACAEALALVARPVAQGYRIKLDGEFMARRRGNAAGGSTYSSSIW